MTLIEALRELRIKHYVNDEDCWYSCPASGECCNENAGSECNCGADKHNVKVDALIAGLTASNREAQP